MSDGNQLLLTKRKSCQVAVCLVSLKRGFRFIDDKDKRMTNSMEYFDILLFPVKEKKTSNTMDVEWKKK
ncbi:hypothetical protein T4E_1572 [Trichinella pseudospiralis]|uniref:Uncharacterized protein n=1 Tax=Trichinella pseudospiralis TaxID=6337 RepID=A0A0V0YHK7_TRIPS|nr:hypothetical protein T4E_1572 [Trichinella pseudospiralis]